MAKCMFFVVVKSNALCSSGVVGIFFSGGGTVWQKKGKKRNPVFIRTRTRAHIQKKCRFLPNMETGVNLNSKNQHASFSLPHALKQ
jgi:hypothetical protein